ncbi:unnamed protein product, partial [Prorocentrum cordatum]
DLPDAVEAVGAACCEPRLLGRLGAASRQLRASVGCPGFARRRAEEMRGRGAAWAAGAQSLELLALALEVQKLCVSPTKNHVYFPYGGGTDLMDVTMHVLDGAAAVCRRYPRLRLHVDAHTGTGAPAIIARTCSLRRAKAVVHALASRGVGGERLSSTAWGKRLAAVWPEPDDDTAARAEVYFCMDGREFPPRPGYYGLVPDPPLRVVGVDLDDREVLEVREELEADFRRRLANLRQSFVMRPGGPLQGLFRRLPAARGSAGGGPHAAAPAALPGRPPGAPPEAAPAELD